jgi:transposase InsO family protein
MTVTENHRLKRGWPTQRDRREAERFVRCRAVAFESWAMGVGLCHRDAAHHIHVSPGTLADWKRHWRNNHLVSRPLGRPCRKSPVAMRNAALEYMRMTSPIVGLPALRHAFPQMARQELQNIQLRYRRLWALNNRRLVHSLDWRRPGAVWAMDHCDPGLSIDGRWPYALSVCDLSTGYQLAWLPVPDQSAESTMDALQWLFLEHGPPLVLKSDNGSGFIAEETKRFLDRWQVLPLFSPPYTPEYNGACEAGIGGLKVRTHEQAAGQGRAGHWTAEDMESARGMGNELHYPTRLHGRTPAAAFRARMPIPTKEREAFQCTVEVRRAEERTQREELKDTILGHAAQSHIDRLAIGRALVDHGILFFKRRSITTPIKSQFCLNIS